MVFDILMVACKKQGGLGAVADACFLENIAHMRLDGFVA
jgi:hypothetical protein